MNLLHLLAEYHKEWLKMAHKFGAGDYAEDIVQEMYIRLNKYIDKPERIMYKNQPNKLFIWVTLRNMVRTFQNFEKIIDKVWDIMKDQHWYDHKMFEIYHTTNMSMRDIEKETGISLFSIFDTLRKSKEYVHEKIKEDYEDYQNGESERI